MKIADTISVNPSKSTLGQVESQGSSIFRSPVIGVNQNTHSIDLVKALFPTSNAGTLEYKKYAVPFRTLFATILIATGILLLTSPVVGYSVSIAICSLCFGASLALGIFTRPVMLGASVYYCIMGALALRAGTPDMSMFSLMFGSAIFAVIGAGKYSCDFLIRHAILRQRKEAERKRKEDLMSYKAFHSVKF